jgi:hypothetical protein
MLKTIWKEINSYFATKERATLKEVSEATGAPISMVAYHKNRSPKRFIEKSPRQSSFGRKPL